MISFTSPSRYAILAAVGDRNYTIQEFSSEQSFRNCEPPLASHFLRGLPNATDILAALPAGYINTSDEPLAVTPSVPESVTARQIRLWLVLQGVSLAAVDAAIDATPDATEREMMRVEWEYAPYIERSHPMLIPLAQILGLNESDIDRAFIEAFNI